MMMNNVAAMSLDEKITAPQCGEKKESIFETVFVYFTNEWYSHTFYLISMLDRETLRFFTLKSSTTWQQILNVKIRKSHNGCQSERKEPFHASIGRRCQLSRPEEKKTQQQNAK